MLKKIWIKDFRNLKETVYSFEKGKSTFIFGENNQGKTNFLEAINLLGNATPTKDLKITNLIKFEKDECFLGSDFENPESFRVYLKLTSKSKKYLIINNKPIKKISYLKEKIFIEYLSAENIRYFIENPEYRRKKLDSFISNYDSEYYHIIKTYYKLIKQKNALLKQRIDKKELKIWNTKLVELADFIVNKRRNVLNLVLVKMRDEFPKFIKLKNLNIDINYKCFSNEEIKYEYKNYLIEKLEKNFLKEIELGYSLYGPHRDDFKITLNNKDINLFYSRGINKLITLLFRLTEIILYEEKYHHSPVLLLDDVLTELDFEIKKEFIKIYETRGQIFYTSVLSEDKEIFNNLITYKMVNGELKNV